MKHGKGKHGPSAMKATNAKGPKHAGVKGPSAMKGNDGKAGKKPKMHGVAHDLHGHLGEHKDAMRDGHIKLEKIKAEHIGGEKYGEGEGSYEDED